MNAVIQNPDESSLWTLYIYKFVHVCHVWMCPQCWDLLYCLPHILEVNITDNFIFYIYWERFSCTSNDTTPDLTTAHVLACCPISLQIKHNYERDKKVYRKKIIKIKACISLQHKICVSNSQTLLVDCIGVLRVQHTRMYSTGNLPVTAKIRTF